MLDGNTYQEHMHPFVKNGGNGRNCGEHRITGNIESEESNQKKGA